MPKRTISDELIKTAYDLIGDDNNIPRQSNLKRAVSTIYYAMFHTVACSCADVIMGNVDNQNTRAWKQVYRSLDHTAAKTACNKVCDSNLGFPDKMKHFADHFRNMQGKRHLADYDPEFRITRSDVVTLIQSAESVIQEFHQEDLNHIRAFAAFLLFKPPRE